MRIEFVLIIMVATYFIGWWVGEKIGFQKGWDARVKFINAVEDEQ